MPSHAVIAAGKQEIVAAADKRTTRTNETPGPRPIPVAATRLPYPPGKRLTKTSLHQSGLSESSRRHQTPKHSKRSSAIAARFAQTVDASTLYADPVGIEDYTGLRVSLTGPSKRISHCVEWANPGSHHQSPTQRQYIAARPPYAQLNIFRSNCAGFSPLHHLFNPLIPRA